MLGSHLSIAGSMVNALREAESLGMDTVQVFTKNQQQWVAKPLDPGMVNEWRAEVSRLGWDRGCDDGAGGHARGRIVSHASYLINLASVNDELWRKSVDLMTDEIERCEALGIPFLVHHPGSFVGGDLETGIGNIARAYEELFRRTRGSGVVSCLEGTAGAGSHIGGAFEHLAKLRGLIIETTGLPERIGFCLDSCHLHAAGYDLQSRASCRAVLSRFDQLCGLSNLRAWHLNDSKGKLGSHLDRHEHIGAGEIGGPTSANRLAESGFAEIMTNPAFARVPKLLETPKGINKGAPEDTLNVNRLRRLAGLGDVPAPAEPGPTSVSAAKERANAAGSKAAPKTSGPRKRPGAKVLTRKDKPKSKTRGAKKQGGSKSRRRTSGR